MKKILVFLIVMMLVMPATACGKSPGNVIDFWGWGEQEEIPVFNEICETFNNTIGKQKGFTVRYKRQDSKGYQTSIDTAASGSKCPDVFYVKDEFFKLFVESGHLASLDEFVQNDSELNLDEMWKSGVSRYRYDPELNTSKETDALWGLPKDVSPTLLYYNQDALEALGIIVISKDIEDIDETFVNDFNREHTTVLSVNDLKRGFYRQFRYDGNPNNWIAPQDNEVMVFNNRIPMSWDECEDLAMITCRLKHNPKAVTDYGFYTEWWFNYAFSVGGTCLEDTTGNGDYIFTLGDELANFRTTESVVINGNTYPENEFVSYIDKKFLSEHSDTEIRLISDGKIQKLPSTREAFTRFVNLSMPGGIQISPLASEAGSGNTKASYFTSGKVAMLVEQSYRVVNFRNTAQFDWDVAPLPIYKKYDDDGNVTVIGKEAAHSNSTCLAVWSKSKKKSEAYEFIKYLSGPVGQAIQGKYGFNLPNQKDVAYESYVEANKGKAPQNIDLFVKAAEFQTPGDWWYLPDINWITVWSVPLNDKVRNGIMSLDKFYNTYIPKTNEFLKNY